jgi:hypothetical protein
MYFQFSKMQEIVSLDGDHQEFLSAVKLSTVNLEIIIITLTYHYYN